MKKIIAIVLALTTFLNINVFAGVMNQFTKEGNAILKLEQFDIVRKPFEKYNEDSTITRQDMMKMIYIVVNASNLIQRDEKSNPRQYILHYDEKKCNFVSGNKDEIIESLQALKAEGEAGMQHYYEFEDVEFASDKHLFVSSLMYYGLFCGIEREGKMYAELERDATYGEALTALCYMFGPGPIYKSRLLRHEGAELYGRDYIKRAKSIGLIKNESQLSEEVSISMDNLNSPIKAYEFMNLLYEALFIPFDKTEGDWIEAKIYGYRYYEPFLTVKDVAEEYEAIID